MTTFKEYAQLAEEFIPHQGTQYGSNDGGVYTHKPSNQKYYVKFPDNEEQARVEVATADIYKSMGIKTLSPVVKHVDGKTAVVTKWQDDAKSLTSPKEYHSAMQDPVHADHLALMHHGAIITGNRDIVGLDYNNVMKHKTTGELISADQGGSMHFRAMGGPKEFKSNIADVHSFQNEAYPSGRVFSKLDRSTLKNAAAKLHTLTDDTIDSIMKKHGLEAHAQTIKDRRDMLINHYQTT
jgi:hypothetical protein